MAASETARLIAALELDPRKFTKGLSQAEKALGKTEGRAYRAGQQIGTGIKRGFAIAAAGVGLVAANVALGVNSLVKLEQAQAQTNAVIKSTGGIARVTGDDVTRLSEKFEALNATIGDEVIRSGENMLLTFTNIRGKAFEPALQAVLDLNTAMGKGPEGLTKTAIQVGKALNDPAKGLTALRKVGVAFSDEQVKRIKQLQKEGKLYDAQKIILKELNREFGGSFLAQGGTTGAKVAKFTDAIEDLQRAMAEALLPAITNIADELTRMLADPAVIAGARDLGKEIGKLFSAQNIKAGAKIVGDVIQAIRDAAPIIKSGLGAAADVIGRVIGEFQKLPPDIQKLVVGALVANKLTGGLITNLGAGIVGAILGQLKSAVVNVQGGVVTVQGAGGAAGAAGAAGAGGAGKLGTALKVLGGITIIGAAAAIADEVHNAIAAGPNIPASQLSWPWGPKNTPKLLPEIFGGNGALGGTPAAPTSGNASDRKLGEIEKRAQQQYDATRRIEIATNKAAMEEHGRGERLITSAKDTKAAITAGTARLTQAERETARETTRGLTATAASTRRGLSNVAETVRRKNLAVTVRNNNIIRVNNQISIRDTARKLSFSQNMAIYG